MSWRRPELMAPLAAICLAAEHSQCNTGLGTRALAIVFHGMRRQRWRAGELVPLSYHPAGHDAGFRHRPCYEQAMAHTATQQPVPPPPNPAAGPDRGSGERSFSSLSEAPLLASGNL